MWLCFLALRGAQKHRMIYEPEAPIMLEQKYTTFLNSKESFLIVLLVPTLEKDVCTESEKTEQRSSLERIFFSLETK